MCACVRAGGCVCYEYDMHMKERSDVKTKLCLCVRVVWVLWAVKVYSHDMN